MRGEGGSCWASADEYSCAHGAQINFGDLTPYLTHGLERLTANAKVATVLGSILASSDSVESEGRQMKQS
jgi:hypothetical protein